MDRFKASLIIASTFFAVGTILFLLQAISREITTATFIGFYFVAIAININIIILVALLIGLMYPKDRQKTLKSIGVISMNIPIAFVYYLIVITYLI